MAQQSCHSGGRPRILIVDDHPLIRKGVVDLLRSRWSSCFVGECGTVADARIQLEAKEWALVVLDHFLPDATGIELVAGAGAKRMLLLTMQRDPGLMVQMRSRGGGGFLCKTEPPERIVEASAMILAGGTWFTDPEPASAPLSERERRVLDALLAGIGPQAIARGLGISRSSVQSYKERLFEKLEVRSLIELGAKAKSQGLG